MGAQISATYTSLFRIIWPVENNEKRGAREILPDALPRSGIIPRELGELGELGDRRKRHPLGAGKHAAELG